MLIRRTHTRLGGIWAAKRVGDDDEDDEVGFRRQGVEMGCRAEYEGRRTEVGGAGQRN